MMEYSKATAEVIMFENEDVVTYSVCQTKAFQNKKCDQGSSKTSTQQLLLDIEQ